jgi:hypothetical protein
MADPLADFHGTCSGPAVLTREGDTVRIHPVDLADYGDAGAYHAWVTETGATILQQCDGEGLFCCVPGCGQVATHAVVRARRDTGTWDEYTACPGCLAGVIASVLGAARPAGQRSPWN